MKEKYMVDLSWVYAMENKDDKANTKERLRFVVKQHRLAESLAPGKSETTTSSLRPLDRGVQFIELSPGGRFLMTISKKELKLWTMEGLLTLATLSLEKQRTSSWSWNQADDSFNVVIRSKKRYVVCTQIMLKS